MMFSDVLKTVDSFPDSEQLLFQKEVKLRNIKKNDVLLQKGDVAKSVFFNLNGLIYQHKHKPGDKNDFNIIDLHLENEWILNHKSFVAQEPADSFISAFTDCCVLELRIESIHYLIGRSLAFLKLNKIMDNAVARVSLFDDNLNPMEKYQFILNHKPRLIQAFPLKMIASYLKVTPETLSRVREKMVRS